MSKSKRKKRTKTNHSLILFLIGFTASIILMAGYIWISNEINSLTRDIARLREVKARLITQNNIIKAEIERLSSADRIKKIASQELNMVIPKPETLFVVVRKDSKNSND